MRAHANSQIYQEKRCCSIFQGWEVCNDLLQLSLQRNQERKGGKGKKICYNYVAHALLPVSCWTHLLRQYLCFFSTSGICCYAESSRISMKHRIQSGPQSWFACNMGYKGLSILYIKPAVQRRPKTAACHFPTLVLDSILLRTS